MQQIKKYDMPRNVTRAGNKSPFLPSDIISHGHASWHIAPRSITSCFILITQLVGRHEDLFNPEIKSPVGNMNFLG